MRSRGEREQQQRSLMATVAIGSDGIVLWCGAVQRRRRCLDKRVYRRVRQGSVKSPLALSFSMVLLLHSCHPTQHTTDPSCHGKAQQPDENSHARRAVLA